MSKYAKHVSQAIDASEMACSLKYEDVRGCPYNVFTPRGIAILSAASSVLAALSLIVAM